MAFHPDFGQDLILVLTLSSTCFEVATKVIDNETAPLHSGSVDACFQDLQHPNITSRKLLAFNLKFAFADKITFRKY